MEGAEKRRERLGDDLSECQSTAPRVRAERMHDAHRKFECDRDCRFDGRNRGAQCCGLLQVAVCLPPRQRELVLELPGRIGHLGLLNQEPVGSV
jgi:hypothetical protein